MYILWYVYIICILHHPLYTDPLGESLGRIFDHEPRRVRQSALVLYYQLGAYRTIPSVYGRDDPR